MMNNDSTSRTTDTLRPQAQMDGMMAYAPVLKQFMLRVFQHRFKAIIVCLVITLAISVITALLFSEQTWKASTTLLYTPLPVPEEFQDLYEPPELQSIQSLALSRPIMEDIKSEFKLPIPVKALRKVIRVQPAPGSDNLLDISVEWGNPGEAASMANRLAEDFRQEVSRIRTSALNVYYIELQSHLKDCKQRLIAARRRLRDFAGLHDVIDADSDLDAIQEEIRSLEESMEKSNRKDLELAAQSEKLAEHIGNLKKKDAEKAEEESQYEAAHESVVTARRRQDRLRELIYEERRVTEVKAQLQAKRREYERAAVLVKKQLIPRTKFEKIQGEMESLMAKIKENERILDWKKELERIDEVVVPKGGTKQGGSPIISQMLFRKLELDLQTLGVQKEMYELQKTLSGKREQREKLIRRRHEFHALEDEVESVDDERRAAEDRMAVFRTLRSLGPVEFSVVSTAKPPKHAFASNRKKFFIGVFGLGALLSLLLVSGVELLKNGFATTDDKLMLLGLNKLGQMPPGVWDASSSCEGRMLPCKKAVRRLALKIRQAVAKPGAIILFSNLNDSGKSPELLAELAWCLSRRDERVLIWAATETPDRQNAFSELIDQECIEPQHAIADSETVASGVSTAKESTALQKRALGLAEYLSFVCTDLHEFITPSMIPGVDCLLSGQFALPTEGIATHRTRELLAQLRGKYSIILVDGPAVSREDDFELLVPYSDGIVFLVRDGARLLSGSGKTLQELYDLRAPIIGSMVI